MKTIFTADDTKEPWQEKRSGTRLDVSTDGHPFRTPHGPWQILPVLSSAGYICRSVGHSSAVFWMYRHGTRDQLKSICREHGHGLLDSAARIKNHWLIGARLGPARCRLVPVMLFGSPQVLVQQRLCARGGSKQSSPQWISAMMLQHIKNRRMCQWDHVVAGEWFWRIKDWNKKHLQMVTEQFQSSFTPPLSVYYLQRVIVADQQTCIYLFCFCVRGVQ